MVVLRWSGATLLEGCAPAYCLAFISLDIKYLGIKINS